MIINKNADLYDLLMKASMFVFLFSVSAYIMLLLINTFTGEFLEMIINIKIPLIVALISGLVFTVTYTNNRGSVKNTLISDDK
ncbi:MAG: hypothetical protein WCW66_01715 [Patescibacteria group bacterium]|jgi:hypothetical protein